MFYVYFLQSKVYEETYIGYTSNLKNRITEHNQGLTPSTKRYKPWELIYYEACLNQKDAKRREHYLKSTQGSRMLRMRLKEYFFEKRLKV
jgi:putative endonuclease